MNSAPTKLYFAAPLFNDMERSFNKAIAQHLASFFDVFLPQQDGGLMVDMVRDGTRPAEAARTVFRMDIDALNKCNVLLIVLDGRTIDEGAAFELGYAFALGKTCVGLQTDVRRLLTSGNNPMIACSLHHLFQDLDELLTWARQYSPDTISVDDEHETARSRTSNIAR
jgi:nucleoside 2-deoxyribosyltransferase